MSQGTYVPEYQDARTRTPRGRWSSIFLVQVVQSFVIIGWAAVLCILVPDATIYLLGAAAASCVFIGGLQVLYLLPITEPQIDRTQRKSISRCICAAVAGLAIGILAFGAAGIIGDSIWFAQLPSTPDTTHMDGDTANVVLLTGFIIFLASWVIMSPLLYIFLRSGSPERRLFQLASSIFLGTIVEGLASVGIMTMMQKRHDCICATFSFAALLASFAIGFLIFGPAVLLLIVWKKSRYRPGNLCPACGAGLPPVDQPARCPRCGAGWKPYPTRPL